ncbi:MAG: hypothetical protein DMG57_34465 [Acidobacteria bacterium]|nr:MAG: hypothetical protein DMG57_34465 [Acidobacteriota bacterium]
MATVIAYVISVSMRLYTRKSLA